MKFAVFAASALVANAAASTIEDQLEDNLYEDALAEIDNQDEYFAEVFENEPELALAEVEDMVFKQYLEGLAETENQPAYNTLAEMVTLQDLEDPEFELSQEQLRELADKHFGGDIEMAQWGFFKKIGHHFKKAFHHVKKHAGRIFNKGKQVFNNVRGHMCKHKSKVMGAARALLRGRKHRGTHKAINSVAARLCGGSAGRRGGRRGGRRVRRHRRGRRGGRRGRGRRNRKHRRGGRRGRKNNRRHRKARRGRRGGKKCNCRRGRRLAEMDVEEFAQTFATPESAGQALQDVIYAQMDDLASQDNEITLAQACTQDSESSDSE